MSRAHASGFLRASAFATVSALTAGIVVPGADSVAAAPAFPPLPGDPPAPPGEDPRNPRPDIVVIILDDIPPLDGRLWKRLPNIRRTFVQQGVEFTDAHVETPTCTPGRAGLLTGLHTHHHGAYKTNGTIFDPGETVATELQAQGYHTVQVGKYINLFDSVYDKTPPGWSDFHGYGGGYYDYTMYSNGIPYHYGRDPSDYSTDVIARLSVQALERAPRKKSLFAWITPFSMHKPWSVAPRHQAKACNVKPWRPKSYMEKNIRDKPAYVQGRKIKQPGGYPLKRICLGLLSVDQLVGRVTRELRRQGRLDNTVLILTSDNGMSFGAQRILHDKKAPYGTQIPLFVRWPRVLGTSPRQVRERVQNIDLAPTLCDIAGCELGPYPTGQAKPDGFSILRLLTGRRNTLARRAVLASYQETGHRITTYWSVTTTGSSPLAKQGCRQRKLARCRWVYTEYSTGETELYDISNGPCYDWTRRKRGDPCMLDNLSGKGRYAEIEQALRRELDRLKPGRALP